MNSLKLRFPAQELHKIEPVGVPVWTRKGTQSSTITEEILVALAGAEKSFFFRVIASHRHRRWRCLEEGDLQREWKRDKGRKWDEYDQNTCMDLSKNKLEGI